MSIQLQPSLVDYFSATNSRDCNAVLEQFADGAVVNDENVEYRGLDSIRGWIAETVERYDFTVEVVDASNAGATTTVTAVVTGNFGGSPVKVRYAFTLDQQKISRLELHG
jgi:hypothetical protein